MTKLRVLDLFSGLGAFSLGLERAGGFETVAFCEIDSYCRRVLARHWPEIPCYHDVRNLFAAQFSGNELGVDVICGGFPCTNVSNAAAAHGTQHGLDGEESGLWFEYLRIIGEFRPKYVIVENVSALLVRGLGTILGGLAALGYDAEWHCIRASAVGLPQIRDRVWLIAYPACKRAERFVTSDDLSHARQGWEGRQEDLQSICDAPFEYRDSRPNALFRRMDDRPPNWVDRVAACGNAVVPQISELIGRAILRAEAS